MAYLHRPEELVAEAAEAGLTPDRPVAVEGLGWFTSGIDALLATCTCNGASSMRSAGPSGSPP